MCFCMQSILCNKANTEIQVKCQLSKPRKMDIALPCWTATDRCWTRYVAACSSLYFNLLPSSFTKVNDCGPKTPENSIVIGANSLLLLFYLYLNIIIQGNKIWQRIHKKKVEAKTSHK